jgi:hypothetical protein
VSTESGWDRVRREHGFRSDRHYHVTGNGDRRPEAWYEENWPEYLDAQFLLLRDIEPELARALAERLVDRIVAGAGLDPKYRNDALEQVAIEVGVLPDGRRVVMEIKLPLGSGRPGYSWDGSVEQAEALIDNAADRGIEDLEDDRSMGYPTGWELDQRDTP